MFQGKRLKIIRIICFSYIILFSFFLFLFYGPISAFREFWITITSVIFVPDIVIFVPELPGPFRGINAAFPDPGFQPIPEGRK